MGSRNQNNRAIRRVTPHSATFRVVVIKGDLAKYMLFNKIIRIAEVTGVPIIFVLRQELALTVRPLSVT